MKQRNTNKKQLFHLLSFFLILLLAFALCGCRESRVIEEILYSQAAEDIDLQNQIKVSNNDENNQQKNEKIEEKKKDDTQRERDRKRKTPLKGDGDSKGTASKAKHDSNSENKNKADDKSNQGGKDKGKGKDGAGGRPDKPQDGDGTGGATNDPNGRKIVDASGSTVKVPKNVDSVTATGEAAVIVQMLGGKGALMASSSDFLSSSLAQSVFGSEGIAKVKSAWDGDGSSAMSESNFQQLLKKKPDVCFSISGQTTFSDSQLSRLKEKKIAVVTLPEMNSQDEVSQSVTIVGEVLGNKSGKGGTNAPKEARRYNAYCKDLVKEVKGKVGGSVYTLFLSDWDEDAHYKLSSGSKITAEGNGVAVTPTAQQAGLVSEYLGVGGAKNSAVTYNSRDKSYWYVSPLAPTTRTMHISGSMASSTAQGVNLTQMNNEDYLGQSGFPGIVVADKEVKRGLEKDRNKGGNNSLWKNYGKVSASSGNVRNGYGFLDEDGSIVSTTIRDDYDIHVNPSGVGDWTGGSVESVLESVWAANIFHNAYSDSQLKAKIKEFYQKFYRHKLTDSEYAKIIAGR